MNDKKFYMNFEEEQHQENNSLKNDITDHIKEQPLDMAMDKMMDGVDIDILDGVVNITMPEPMFLLMKELISKLNINLLNENTQGISR